MFRLLATASLNHSARKSWLAYSFFATLALFAPLAADAQLSSGNAFLQGNFVEVGVAPCGSFGSTIAPPAGYHPRGGGGALGFVADPAKDGWTSGSPDYVGDYFLPGSPEEGWGITINGTNYNNNQVCSENNIPGSVTSYSSDSTKASATWQGSKSGLSIIATSTVPKTAGYFITKVNIVNTSTDTVRNIYYMRNVDPDHGVSTPGAGGTFNTNNSVVYQNPADTCDRALASATTASGGHYLGLGSVDPRARVTTGGFSNRNAQAVWAGTGLFTSGSRMSVDEAISMSFNLGNLAPNQSTEFAYAYILSASDLSAALAATNVGVNVAGATYTTGSTINICSGDTVPITLVGDSAYSYTWSPPTGLDTTAGTTVNATVTGPITYTATGVGPCDTITVIIPLNPVVAGPVGTVGSITGPDSIGLGQTGVTYSVAPVTNATSYKWSLPPGSVVTSSATSSSITFNASSTTWCGNITVMPSNVCDTGATATKAACLLSLPREIDVQGAGISIVDGDATPATTDNTDFGSTTGAATRSYVIKNTGQDTLKLSGVTIGGAAAADFSIAGSFDSVLTNFDSTTLTIAFAPLACGIRTAEVQIASNDASEPVYNFAIQGESLPAGSSPGCALGSSAADFGNAQPLVGQKLVPSCAGSINAATVAFDGAGSGTVTAQIRSGNCTGTVLTSTVATIPGSGDFTFNFPTPASVTAGQEYTLLLTSSAGGIMSFPLSYAPGSQVIYYSSCSSGAYSGYALKYAINVSPTGPDVDVRGAGLSVADGDSTPSTADGTLFDSVVSTRTFTVRNTAIGCRPLSVAAVTITGPAAADFSVVDAPDTSVATSDSSTFTIAFSGTDTGLRTAEVHVANGDADEADYNFAIAAVTMANTATALYVNDSVVAGDVYTTAVGSDLNPGTPASPYRTIGRAVSQATAGDTIYVDAGAYAPTTTIVVDKNLLFLGANAGTAGTATRGAEAAVQTPAGAPLINAMAGTTSTFDGFKLDGGAVVSINNVGGGINLALRNSVVSLASVFPTPGIYFGSGQLTLADNLFRTLSATAGGASHIQTPDGTVVVTGNTFTSVDGLSSLSATVTSLPVWLNLGGNLGAATVTNNIFQTVDIGILFGNNAGNLTIERNRFSNAKRNTYTGGGSFGTGIAVFGSPTPTGPVRIRYNVFDSSETGIRTSSAPGAQTFPAAGLIEASYNHFTNISNGALRISSDYTGTLAAKCNWYGAVTGPTISTNPGASGQTVVDPNGTAQYRNWLMYGTDASTAIGVQLPSAFTVAPGTNTSPAQNHHRILSNAVGCLVDSQTLTVSGTYNFANTIAQLDWSKGNDGTVGNADDYSITTPANVHRVTLAGAAGSIVQGPGDLAGVDQEKLLYMNAAPNRAWTIRGMDIRGFDVSIGAFSGVATDAYDSTRIIGNSISIPADLNATAAPSDGGQNIGLHISFGKGQVVDSNLFTFDGTGASAGTARSNNIGVQTNTSGSAFYDGFRLRANTFTVTGVPATDAAVVRAVWENFQNTDADIQVTDNIFSNADPANTAALNRQTAVFVTSASGPTKTVQFSRNEIRGWERGIEWMGGPYTGNTPPDYAAGETPVLVQNNIVDDARFGVTLRKAAGSANPGSPGVVNFNSFTNILAGGAAVNNEASGITDASCNWYGGVFVPAPTAGLVDATPFLISGTDTSTATGFQPAAGTCTDPITNLNTGLTYGSFADAIAAATAGDSLAAIPGLYNEDITVTKSLTFYGANRGTPGTGTRATETILTADTTGGAQLLNLSAGVTAVFDGFAIRGKNLGTVTGAATSLTLKNNVADLYFGDAANNLYFTGGGALVIDSNLWRADSGTNVGGASSHIFASGGTLEARGNTFTSVDAIPALTGATTSLPVWMNVTTGTTAADIRNNIFDKVDIGILLADNASGVAIENNIFSEAKRAAYTGGTAFGAGIALFGTMTPTALNTIRYNVFDSCETGIRTSSGGGPNPFPALLAVNYNHFTNTFRQAIRVGTTYTGTLNAKCNYYDAATGPVTASNPGAAGDSLLAPAGVVDFRNWLIYSTDASADLGVQLPSAFTVTPGADVSVAENPYRILSNAVGCLVDSQTLTPSGTFDWSTGAAYAEWAKGNDGDFTNDDDNFSILVTPDVRDITITSVPGATVIQGPGDIDTFAFEGFLYFDGAGDYKRWTIENLDMRGFDNTIAAYFGAGGVDSYDSLTVRNSRFVLPADLNDAAAPADDYQNIALHYSFGKGQRFTGNTFEIAGDGVSDSAAGASSVSVAMQSNTSGGTVYDGLLIDSNTVTVTGTPAGDRAVILGFWENSHNEGASIQLSRNIFTNSSAANTAGTNDQVAFVVTSKSGAGGSVVYSANEINRWQYGLDWLGGPLSGFTPPNYTATALPVVVTNNVFDSLKFGVVVRKDSSAGNPGSPAIVNNNTFVNTVAGGFAVGNTSTGTTDAQCNFYDGIVPLTFGDVDATPFLTNGTDVAPGTRGFQPVSAACTGFPVTNITTGVGYNTFTLAEAAATAGDTLVGIGGTYGERFTISKSLTVWGDTLLPRTTIILDGTGLGNGSAITIAAGVTNVAIRNLTIQDYTGTSPNTNAGIYATGGNNNLSISDVFIHDNAGLSGIYANGPVDGVTIDSALVTNHPATAGAARGIVVWNGFKQNITIKNSTVSNNNCCGIELQDGTASGVLIQNNTISGVDNAIGVVGLTSGAGPNIIEGNTITVVGGRFGIELKNPAGTGEDNDTADGSIIVRNNTVTLTSTTDARDLAGISAYRRSVGPGNVDVPTGVVIKNNTVSGFVQPSTSTGFGIVVEGANHKVLANTVTGNDVGIQRQSGHTPYPGDGNQANIADAFFGRGNSPVSCGIEVTGNTPNTVTDVNYFGDRVVTNTNSGSVFCTINSAIDSASAGDTLLADAGRFVENVEVDRRVILLGANAGVNPNTGVRSAETIVTPAASDPDFASAAASFIIDLQSGSSGTAIDGLMLDGKNDSLAGTGIDAAEGIVVFAAGVDSLQIRNNILQNISDLGIDFYDVSGAVKTGSAVTANRFANILDTPFGVGMYIGNDFYTNVTSNVVDSVRVGIQTGNFYQADPLAFRSITGNTVSSSVIGIWHNLAYSGASPFTITGNRISAVTGADSTNIGIEVSSIQSSVSAVIGGNTITGGGAGYDLWNNPTTSTITLEGDSILGARVGVYANNWEGYSEDAATSAYAINNVYIQNASVAGVFVQDDSLNTNGATVSLAIGDSTVINGGTTGLRIEGAGASASFAGADPAAFAGQTVYIEKRSNGIDKPGMNTDATEVRFDGTMGAVKNLTDLFATEDKIIHAIDDDSLGFVTVRDSNTYVTTASFVAPATASAQVQRGVDAASTGFTVNVADGTYNGDIDVDQTLTIAGQSPAAVLRGLYAGDTSTVRITVPNVAVRNLTVTRDFGTTLAQYQASTKLQGINITPGGSGARIDSVIVTDNRAGILVNDAQNVAIRTSTIDSNRTGVVYWNDVTGATLQNNFIRGNFSHGIRFDFDRGVLDAAGAMLTGNDLSGNWYGQISFQRASAPVSNVGNLTGLSATCNWYGTTTPDLTAVTTSEPAYATQVPAQFGGMDPMLNQDLVGVEADTIPYVPYLTVGTDAAPIAGFQPQTGACNGVPRDALFVNDAALAGDVYTTAPGSDANGGTPNAPLATLNAAVARAQAGDTIFVDAGTYREDVVVNKKLTILGTNAGRNPNDTARIAESMLQPFTSEPDIFAAAPTTVLLLAAGSDSTVLDGLTVNGDNTSVTSGYVQNGADFNAASGIAARTALNGLRIQNNIFRNIVYAAVNFEKAVDATVGTGNLVQSNYFNNIVDSFYGIGVLQYNNLYADVLDNVMDTVSVGIQTGNNYVAAPGDAPRIMRNDVQSEYVGVFHNLQYGAASPFTITGNTVSTKTVGGETFNTGIFIASIAGGVGTTVDSNTIAGTYIGYDLWNNPTIDTVEISRGSVTGTEIGVWANNWEGYNSDGASSAYVLRDMTISSASATGIYVQDDSANTLGATTHVRIQSVTLTGADTGLVVEGAGASVALSGATPAVINGSAIAIHLASNGVDVPTGDLDATDVIFDGMTGAAKTLPELFSLEDKIIHGVDDGARGFVLVRDSNTYVTTASFAAPATASAQVQRAVDNAGAGFTVNVANGVYNGDVTIPQTMTVIGQSRAATLRGLYTGAANTVTLGAPGITLRNLTVTRDYGTTLADWYASTKNQGVSVPAGAGGAVLDSLVLTGNRNAVFINNAQNVVVRNSRIDSNRTGVHYGNNVSGLVLQNNFIRANYTHGVLFNFDLGVLSATGGAVNFNDLGDNWYSQLTFQRGAATPATNVGDFTNFSATCDWYGTTNPDVAAVPAGEPGYAAQIPAQFGGTDPMLMQDLRGTEIALANYAPFLVSGVDTNLSVMGFQPQAGSCNGFPTKLYVNDSVLTSDVYTTAFGNDANGGTPQRPLRTLAFAISRAEAGDTIYVDAGQFTGNVVVNKRLTIIGADDTLTTLYPSVSNPIGSGGSLGGSTMILVQADTVRVLNLGLDGNNSALTSSVTSNGVDVDARIGIGTNHNTGVWDSLTVRDVWVRNVYLRGIAQTSDASYRFERNRVQNVAGDPASIGILNFGGAGRVVNNTVVDATDGIALNNSAGSIVEGNTVTGGDLGIHTDNSGSSAGSGLDSIRNNTVSGGGAGSYGILVFGPYKAVAVHANTVTGAGVGLAAAGQYAPSTVNFSANTVNGGGAAGSIGVLSTTDLFGFGTATVSAVLTNNFIQDVDTAFRLQADATRTNNTTATSNSITDYNRGVQQTSSGTFNLAFSCNFWDTTDAGYIASFAPSAIPYLLDGTDTSAAVGFQPGGTCTAPVYNVTQATFHPSIQSGVSAATAGDSLVLPIPYTFREYVVVDKSLTINGMDTATRVVMAPGAAAAGVTPALFKATAQGITLRNMKMMVDVSYAGSAVITSGSAGGLKVLNNAIEARRTLSTQVSYGNRNALSINAATSPGVTGVTNVTGFTGVVVQGNNIYMNPAVTTASPFAATWRSAVAADGVSLLVGGAGTGQGNTLSSVNHDVIARFNNSGKTQVIGNTIIGGGVQLSEGNAGSDSVVVRGNQFAYAPAVAPAFALLRLQNNGANIPTSVQGNTFTGHNWYTSLENYQGVTLAGNTFTPVQKGTATTFRLVTMNTKTISSTATTAAQKVPISATLAGNTFNGATGFADSGIAVAFYNHDTVGAKYGTVTMGTAASPNTFGAAIGRFFVVDSTNGVLTTAITAAFPEYAGGIAATPTGRYTMNILAINNTYNIGGTAVAGTSLTDAQIAQLETQRVQDFNDNPLIGDVNFNGAIPAAVTVFLQGATPALGGAMTNFLQTEATSAPVLPATNPYGLPGTYSAINDTTGPAGKVTDWVRVQIRDGANPSIVLQERALLLKPTGAIVDTLGAAPMFALYNDTVRIVVFHRNHLAVMSQDIPSFATGTAYDFTASADAAFRSAPTDPQPTVLRGGRYCMYAGDINQNGVISSSDFTSVLSGFGAGLFDGYFAEDLNLDGIVNNTDLSLMLNSFQTGAFSPIIDY